MDPKERLPGPATIIEDIRKLPPGVAVPDGVNKTKDYQGWYAQKHTTQDGRTWYEFYKRGPALPEGRAPQDPVYATIEGPLDTQQAEKFKKEQDEAAKPATVRDIGGVPHQPAGKDAQGRDIWVPIQAAGTQGQTAQVEGTPDASQPSGFDNGRPRMVTRKPDGTLVKAEPLTPEQRAQWEREQAGVGALQPATAREPVKGHPGVYAVKTVDPATKTEETHYEDEGRRRVPEPQAAPTPVASTLNTGSPQIGMVLPNGDIRWTPNPNYQKPKPEPLNLSPTQRSVVYMNPDGTTTVEKNPNYVKPSKLDRDPSGRWIQVTEDDDGNPVIKPVTDQTIIKPAEIPVLQAKYGQIGQSLGAYLTDLNGRVSRGEMTPQERDAAFKAAHQQAEVQVSEINSILESSKAVWSNQIQERGQTFGEAANRRSFAGSVMGNAMSTGREIAQGALPGSGRAIAEGVMTLMDMGQRYAAGMGGFPSMAPTPLPPALQQAAGMSLPGFGPESGGPPPGAPPPGGPPSGADVAAANAATQAQGAAAFGGLGIPPPGGAPPAGRPAPLLPPPPPVPGQSPLPPGGPRVAPPSAIEPIPNAVPGQGSIPPIPNAVPGQGSIRPIPLAPPGPLGGLGSLFGAGVAGSPMGVPASAGGGGLFDPTGEARAMLAASTSAGSYGGEGGADGEWERAVRAAMGLFG